MHTLRECILCGRVVVFQADYIGILISPSKLRFIVFAWLRCSLAAKTKHGTAASVKAHHRR